MLSIDAYYTTAPLVWDAPIVELARNIYYGSRNIQADAGRAYRASIEACKQDTRCLTQVAQFFGLTSVAIPVDTPYGLSNIINDLLRWADPGIAIDSLTNSAANKLFNKFNNGSICKLISDSKDKNLCET
jgi:hypothetical protein